MKTTTQYFSNCLTLDALKSERNRLALIHHPDRGGDLAVMQEINAQFETARKRLSAPPASRTYACPRTSPWDNLYENLRQKQAEEEARRRAREAENRKRAQEEINRQRNQWAAEIEWALEQLYKLGNQGNLRGCYIEKGTRVGVPYLEITGNSYPYKEQLKLAGFRWNPERKVWYFHKKPANYQEYKQQQEQKQEKEQDNDDDDYFNTELEDIPF